MSSTRLHKVSSKLLVLSLGSLAWIIILVGLLIHSTWTNYRRLQNPSSHSMPRFSTNPALTQSYHEIVRSLEVSATKPSGQKSGSHALG